MSKKVYVKPYPKEFREQVVKLVKLGDRSALEVAREFEISVDSVRRWVQQAERDQGRRQDGRLPGSRWSPSSPRFHCLPLDFSVPLRHHGAALSRAAAPTAHRSVHETVATSEGAEGREQAYRALGLPPGAPHKDVKSAYRRLALATHPDRNPGDEDATAKFRLIQGAYERIFGSPATTGATSAGMTVSMEIQGFGPTASFLVANAAGVVAGSSQGRLYVFDDNGSLREARVLGDGPVLAVLRSNGTVGAAWCNDALFFFKENKIVNAAEAIDWPHALTMLGDDIVLARCNEVQVMDTYGRLLWSVEFSKTVTGIAAHGDTLVCTAGVLTAFRRKV